MFFRKRSINKGDFYNEKRFYYTYTGYVVIVGNDSSGICPGYFETLGLASTEDGFKN